MSKVAIVGVEGSGKTVLMAAMGEMYGQASNDSLFLMPENQAAFSFMTQIPHKMRVERQWPEATAIESMKHLKWTVRVGTEVLTELEMLDYPGELYRMAFGDRKEGEIEDTKEQIHEFLEHLVTADFLIVLLNLNDAMDIGANARNNETVWLTRGIFDYAKKLPNINNRLLVFTQADRYRDILENAGGAKAIQEKYLPMLSILHPDLECTAISAVTASESTLPGSAPTTDGGMQELMAQIIMASETGRRALELHEKCQLAAIGATSESSSISSLEEKIGQYEKALNALGSSEAGVICSLYPGALDSHTERINLLKEFASELHQVRATNSVESRAGEQAWAGLLKKYEDIPGFVSTIRSLIRFYQERKQADKTARKVIISLIAFVIGIGLYLAWQSWADKQVTELSKSTGLSHTVCEQAFSGDANAQYNVGRYFLTKTNQKNNLIQAVDWLKKSAADGNITAQNELCLIYYEAPLYLESMPSDGKTAQWFRRKADHGLPWAQNILGEIYYEGLGIAKDENEALRWWMASAEKGNSYGMVNVANAKCRDGGDQPDYEGAVKWYRQAADLGFAEAQLSLAELYWNGQGVEKDDAEAARLLRQAAEQGEVVAQSSLAYLYLEGQGVKKNDAAAAKWYRKAAEQGDADAQLQLGMMYVEGSGLTANDTEAVKWIRRAAEQGDCIAQRCLGVMYDDGRGVASNITEAARWYLKAAKQGDVHAQYILGALYAEGRGVTQNITISDSWYKRAFEQYREAAEGGDPWGQNRLANCYYGGTGVEKDEKEAAKWYLKAAAQGDSNAQYSLGLMYFNRRSVGDNGAKAIEWFQKAADQGDPTAQYSMGVIYEEGNGVGKNIEEAIKWYEKSAAQGYGEAQKALEQIQQNRKNKRRNGPYRETNDQSSITYDYQLPTAPSVPVVPQRPSLAKKGSGTTRSWEDRRRQEESEKLKNISGQQINWTQYSWNQLFDMRMAAEEIQKLNRLTQSNYDWRKYTHSQAFDMRMAAENNLR